jgi:hypothetical protein
MNIYSPSNPGAFSGVFSRSAHRFPLPENQHQNEQTNLLMPVCPTADRAFEGAVDKGSCSPSGTITSGILPASEMQQTHGGFQCERGLNAMFDSTTCEEVEIENEKNHYKVGQLPKKLFDEYGHITFDESDTSELSVPGRPLHGYEILSAGDEIVDVSANISSESIPRETSLSTSVSLSDTSVLHQAQSLATTQSAIHTVAHINGAPVINTSMKDEREAASCSCSMPDGERKLDDESRCMAVKTDTGNTQVVETGTGNVQAINTSDAVAGANGDSVLFSSAYNSNAVSQMVLRSRSKNKPNVVKDCNESQSEPARKIKRRGKFIEIEHFLRDRIKWIRTSPRLKHMLARCPDHFQFAKALMRGRAYATQRTLYNRYVNENQGYMKRSLELACMYLYSTGMRVRAGKLVLSPSFLTGRKKA